MNAASPEHVSFPEAIDAFRKPFATVFERLLPSPNAPEGRLYEAMRYAALGDGKRLRPYILYASAGMFETPDRFRFRVGAALEMVHAYSLVHDDLPAMDDDDLRRGRPTCHVVYDDATAILVGDALQALAFEVLSSEETHPDPGVRCALVGGLARASGGGGMVGGQILDLQGGSAATVEDRRRLAQMKTGALFAFAAEAGAILGQAAGDAHRALSGFGTDLGFAFQAVDDLLDEEGEEAQVGKRLRKDADAGKPTLVSKLGRDGTRNEARRAVDSAIRRLDRFGSRANALRQTARFILERSR